MAVFSGGGLVGGVVAYAFSSGVVVDLCCAGVGFGGSLMGLGGAGVRLFCAVVRLLSALRSQVDVVVGDWLALSKVGATLSEFVGALLGASPGFFGHSSTVDR